MHLDAGRRYGRESTCGKKVDYKSEESAARAAEAMSAKADKPLEPYPCFWCDGWHIGRKMAQAELEEASGRGAEPTYVYMIEDRGEATRVVCVDDPEVAKVVAGEMVQDFYGRPIRWEERSDGELAGTYHAWADEIATIYCFRFLVRTGVEQETMLGKSEGRKDDGDDVEPGPGRRRAGPDEPGYSVASPSAERPGPSPTRTDLDPGRGPGLAAGAGREGRALPALRAVHQGLPAPDLRRDGAGADPDVAGGRPLAQRLYVHVPSIDPARGGDVAKLEFWGLIEEERASAHRRRSRRVLAGHAAGRGLDQREDRRSPSTPGSTTAGCCR